MIRIKTQKEIAKMRTVCRMASDTLDHITPYVKAGVPTVELDRLCNEFIIGMGAVSACIGYRGYPKSVCISVNDTVCHGIPDNYELQDGDIVNIDVTVLYQGYHGDTSRMFVVGGYHDDLSYRAYETMMQGIRQIQPNRHLGTLGWAMESYALMHGLTTVHEYCGHGIGTEFHEEGAYVLNYGVPGEGQRLKPGMIFTVEPMVNEGSRHTKLMGDEWTVKTVDGMKSAQWEHTVLVTDHGYEVLT